MNERDLSRVTRPFLEKAQFWLKKPRGLIIRGTERVFSKVNLFELLLTRNSADNLSIDLDFIISNLAKGKELTATNSNALFRMIVLNDVIASPKSGLVKLPSNHIFAPFHSDREFFGGNKADEISKLQLASKQNKCNKLVGTFSVLPIQTYYYHFIVDELPKIIQSIVEYPDTVIITPRNQPSFVLDFLRDAGIRYKVEEKPVQLQEMLICIPTSFKPNREKIHIIRNFFTSLYNSEPSDEEFSSQPFFVSRRDTKLRYNHGVEKSIISKLKESDVQVLKSGHMSLKQQVLKFQRVRKLHGLHGSGLVNMVFMQPGGSVHEYVIGNFVPYFYRELSELCGHQYSVDCVLE